jgi:hypothetical protein
MTSTNELDDRGTLATIASGGNASDPRAPSAAVSPNSFSLSSLLLLFTLISLVLGLYAPFPVVSFYLTFVLVTSWVRTAQVLEVRATRGVATPQRERVWLFLRSIGTTIAVILLTFGLFFGGIFLVLAAVYLVTIALDARGASLRAIIISSSLVGIGVGGVFCLMVNRAMRHLTPEMFAVDRTNSN